MQHKMDLKMKISRNTNNLESHLIRVVNGFH